MGDGAVQNRRMENARTLAPMTRARTHTWEMGNQPLSHLLLAAVLCALVSLVQGVATMFGMRRRSSNGDWHTEAETLALPQTKPDIQFQESNSTPGAILGLVPRISVGTPQGLANIPRETHNRDSRDALHSPENDTVDVALDNASLIVIPDARSACEPEPRGDKHGRRHTRLLASRSRNVILSLSKDAPGMTPLPRQKTA
jgi:hypothetical protein